MRFGSTLRYFCSILFIVNQVLYLPIAIYVPALTFNQMSGIGVYTITPIVCLVCTFYTCVGGLKAVVWSDVIQSFVMYGSILTICIKGTWDVGGLGIVIQRNLEGGRLNMPELTWDPTARLSMASVLIGGTLHKLQSSDVNQVSIQRFLSLPSLKHVYQTMWVFTIALLFLLGCSSYLGLVAYATYHDCDPLTTKLAKASDQLPSLLAMQVLDVIPGLPGCFVAGVFSAALSSLSTGLNSLACVITQDVIKPFRSEPLSERQVAIVLRLIVVFFGIGCIGLVFVVEKLGMVVQMATMTSAVSMGPLLSLFTLGVCVPWVNEKSALTGSITSFLILSWICTKAMLASMNGKNYHEKLPVSVENCSYTFENVTTIHHIDQEPYSGDRDIYHLSFLWFTAFGCLIGVTVAGLSTLIFGVNDIENVEPELISPLLRRFLPQQKRQYSMVHLEDIVEEKLDGNDASNFKNGKTKLSENEKIK